MANNSIHLTILRRGDVHVVDVGEVHTIIPRDETRVAQAFLDDLSQEIKRLASSVTEQSRLNDRLGAEKGEAHSPVVKDLKNLGALIFSHLLTDAARDKIQNSNTCDLYLRLDETLVDIPWEVAFDGQDFLGMKFRVGRQIITNRRARRFSRGGLVTAGLTVLIISDPSESLKTAPEEAEELCKTLDQIPTLTVRLLGGRAARRLPLLAALRESDIVHFAGHSRFDQNNPEDSGLVLYDGVLSASEISRLDKPPLLVFANSCEAANATDFQRNYSFESNVFGLGSAFLLAGVRNYIGSFYSVPDEEARFVAVDFYRRVVRGASIGEALLSARLETARAFGLGRPVWAGYLLYGDPALRLCEKPAHIRADYSGVAPVPGPIQLKSSQKSPRRSFRLIIVGLSIFLLATAGVLILSRNREVYLPWEQNESRSNAHSSLAKEYDSAYRELAQGRATSARSQFYNLTARKDNPEGLGYDGLALLHFEAGQTEKAMDILREAIGQERVNSMVYLIQGDLYVTQGDMEKALAAYRLAASSKTILDWQRSAPHNALGVLYFAKGDVQKAEQQFLNAASAYSNDASAFSNLGFLYLKRKNVIKATQFFTKALSIQAEDPLALYFQAKTTGIEGEKFKEPTKARSKEVRTTFVRFAQSGGVIRRAGLGDGLTGVISQSLALATGGVVDTLGSSQRYLGQLTLAESKVALDVARQNGSRRVIFGSVEDYVNTTSVNVKVVSTEGSQLIQEFRVQQQGVRRFPSIIADVVKRLEPVVRSEE